MKDLLILVGPTGVGKTAVAIELCELLNGEIVSADSMQIYRGLDIGTAKPSAEEQASARHHLIDIRDPHESYSAAQWAADARAAIDEIRARGKTPVIAGGTGFYLRALLEPESLAAVPPNPEIRTELEREAIAKGAAGLHARLEKLDAAAAARLHENDTRRVIRAIEVALAESEKRQLPATTPFNAHIFGLSMPREQLVQRLEQRIDLMLQAGFMEELRALVDEGTPFDSIAMQGVGYRQMLPALNRADLLPEAIELWKRDTRRYAKRQMTWFRHQLPVEWLELREGMKATEPAREIANRWRGKIVK